MWIYFLLFAILLFVLYTAPIMRPRKPVLPVLLIGKTGTAPAVDKHKQDWLCEKKLEKLFSALQRKGFTSVLPADILSGKLPAKPVCLVFTGGYQSFARLVFPLLEKYNLRAGTVLHAGLTGQYDAWQKPDEGPWQSLLTAADIKHLQAGGRVEFISSTVDGLPLAQEDDTRACWQLTENKTRMEHLHKLHVRAVYFPQTNPRRPAVLRQARQDFALLIGNEHGNNLLPTDFTVPLQVFRIHQGTSFTRLLWKMTRQ